ncbi:hypothetical protein DRE_04838 [Drechslerella stenobrocha 248]|uniref:Mediator of RNA polymerase II transcription subunit 18 n=1 Tax=Drechslerella stenobrocha 248 TaxID=1043628 RepID=W7HP08_9PEZI|nr:hypothetical protein DRE_04838 [Drechslerella stenobrocha 248]
MHELALFAHVPDSRVAQVERALTTVTGMTAARMLEHHLIYKPKRNRQTTGGNANTGSGTGPANSAAGDFYYLKLVADILEGSDGLRRNSGPNGDAMEVDSGPSSVAPLARSARSKDGPMKVDSLPYDVRRQRWTIRFSDLPEVNSKRPVTSRMIHHAAVSEGDALSFVESLGYTFLSEYILAGHYFVSHHIYITLAKIMLPHQPFTPLPVSGLQPLDPVDSYILQASIKVFSANEQETMNKGVEALKTLKNELKGIVDLEVGDRLSLDTRVR